MPRLTKARVLSEAIALLDDVGADALTMRRLAERLGVQAGALYWHYANKQQLLAAMAEEMLAGVALENDHAPARWRERILEQLLVLRRALLAHRDGGRVFAGTFVAEPNTLAVGEVIVGALREVGLDKREAAWSALSLVHFVIGFVVEEQAAAGIDSAELERHLDRERHAHLVDVAKAFTSADFDARMTFGVNLLLDGVERALERTATAISPRAQRSGAQRAQSRRVTAKGR